MTRLKGGCGMELSWTGRGWSNHCAPTYFFFPPFSWLLFTFCDVMMHGPDDSIDMITLRISFHHFTFFLTSPTWVLQDSMIGMC